MLTHHVNKRGDKYVYRRRVPKHLKHLDPRKEVKISLKTENEKEALIKAAIYNKQIETFWRALVQSGKSQGIDQKYKAAVRLAQAHGFAYKTTEQVAASTLEEIVKRLSSDFQSQQKVEAVLGGANDSKIKLSDCTELYWDLVHDRLTNKSKHQIKKWKNPRKAAIKHFVEVVGDKSLQSIDKSDILTFRKWLNKRIQDGLSPYTANTQLRFVRDMLQTVAVNNEIEIEAEALFIKTRFHYEPQSRPPFEASYVEKVLLNKLDGLNERDRHVMFAMADTGARESEIFGLLPDDIKLDDEIPYIWIRARKGYTLKTKTSERKIPLVGTALEAFKRFPDGFNHKGNPDTFSNIVNKYLTENKLRPTPNHSAYSLRHTFKDRLRDIEAPEEIIDGLMGHKKSGPKYGRGHKLETKNKWMKKIAYCAQR